MKQGYADSAPDLIRYKGETIRVYYDVVEEEYTDPMIEDVKIRYKFSYVDILPSYTRGQIIDALISNPYSKDTEIALINNELTSPGTEAYAEYQIVRQHAKDIATLVLARLNP